MTEDAKGLAVLVFFLLAMSVAVYYDSLDENRAEKWHTSMQMKSIYFCELT
jgi:hypothetical protein